MKIKMVKRPSGKYALRTGFFFKSYLDLRNFYDPQCHIDDVLLWSVNSFVKNYCETVDIVKLKSACDERERVLRMSDTSSNDEVLHNLTV